MPGLLNRFNQIIVNKKLKMGKGAQIVATNAAGAETVVDMTELAVLGGVTASAAELNIMDGVTATAAEINMAADSSANVEIVTATNVISAAESGTTYFLNSASEFVSTLPAPAAGLRFSFIVTGAPTGASYTIGTNAAAQVIVGHVLTSATAIGDSENTLGANVITFVDGQSVIGDRVDVISDGTNWYATAMCAVAAGITYTG
jgi:hypothetical protein